MTVAIATTIELFCNSDQVGHETLLMSSLYDSFIIATIFDIFFKAINKCCTGGETRTPSQWFWRPLLYQLSYTRLNNKRRFKSSLIIKTILITIF